MKFPIKPGLSRRSQCKTPLVYMVETVGAERGMHYYTFSLVPALNQLGIDVVLVSTTETATHPLKPDNVAVRDGFRGIYGEKPKWLRGMNYALALARLGWWIFWARPQIAHFHFFQVPLLDYSFLLFLKLLGTSIVITVHDVLPFRFGQNFRSFVSKIYRRIYLCATGLIVHSEYTRQALARVDGRLATRAVLIPHGSFVSVGVEMRQQHLAAQSNARVMLGLAPSTPMILVFGTIKANKRLDLAIEAMADVTKRYPDARLLVVGKPQDRSVSDEMELAKRFSLASNVLWRLERVSDEELICYFAAADVVLFPYEWIYQSGALLMAMSLGKPVVSTAVGSNTDIIRDGVTGMLVSLNPKEIARAIEKLLGDPWGAQQIGDAAREYVATELSWDKIARSIVTFYEMICQGAV